MLRALPAGFPATAELLWRLEGLKQEQCRGQAGQERDEEATRDQGVHWTPDHVDQKHCQHHHRDGHEQEREHPHDAKYIRPVATTGYAAVAAVRPDYFRRLFAGARLLRVHVLRVIVATRSRQFV